MFTFIRSYDYASIVLRFGLALVKSGSRFAGVFCLKNMTEIKKELKLFDKQGNPVDESGQLLYEEVENLDGITDSDFREPYRSLRLPDLPENLQRAIGVKAKPVVIKRNILLRNSIRHSDLTPSQSRYILNNALYKPLLYGRNRPVTRPYNWLMINMAEKEGKNSLVLLEVNLTKESVEIIHWHFVDKRGMEKIKRQAAREDGRLLILPPE